MGSGPQDRRRSQRLRGFCRSPGWAPAMAGVRRPRHGEYAERFSSRRTPGDVGDCASRILCEVGDRDGDASASGSQGTDAGERWCTRSAASLSWPGCRPRLRLAGPRCGRPSGCPNACHQAGTKAVTEGDNSAGASVRRSAQIADSARLLVTLFWPVAERRLAGSGRRARGCGPGRGLRSRRWAARP